MPSDKAADWDSAKADFKEVTNAKKPRVKVLGLFKTGHTGLSSALKTCDKLVDDLDNIAKLKAAVADLSKKANSYIATLDQSMKKETDASPTESTAMAKALRALRTRLLSYVAFFENKVGTNETVKAGGGAREIALNNQRTLIKQALAVCVANIAAVNAKPTAKQWNDLLGNGSNGGPRKLTTALKSFKQVDPTDRRADAHVTALAPYADGNLRTLPDTATAADVKRHLGDFAVLVKNAKTAFA